MNVRITYPDLTFNIWKSGYAKVDQICKPYIGAMHHVNTKNYDDSGRSLKTAVRRGPKYLNPAMCLTAIFYILSSPPRRLVLRLSKILVDNRDFFIPHLLSMPPFWGLRQNIAVRFGTENLEWRGYPTMKKVWGYDFSFWYNTRTWHTDSRRDRHRTTA